MKKIFCAVLMVCVMCSGGYAVSEDMSVYVKHDVFDAKMEMLFTRLHSEIENLGTRLEGRINALSERIDGMEKCTSSTTTTRDIMMYLPFIFLGAIVIMIYAIMFMDTFKGARTPAVTLEDVRRIVSEAIMENNARIRS